MTNNNKKNLFINAAPTVIGTYTITTRDLKTGEISKTESKNDIFPAFVARFSALLDSNASSKTFYGFPTHYNECIALLSNTETPTQILQAIESSSGTVLSEIKRLKVADVVRFDDAYTRVETYADFTDFVHEFGGIEFIQIDPITIKSVCLVNDINVSEMSQLLTYSLLNEPVNIENSAVSVTYKLVARFPNYVAIPQGININGTNYAAHLSVGPDVLKGSRYEEDGEIRLSRRYDRNPFYFFSSIFDNIVDGIRDYDFGEFSVTDTNNTDPEAETIDGIWVNSSVSINTEILDGAIRLYVKISSPVIDVNVNIRERVPEAFNSGSFDGIVVNSIRLLNSKIVFDNNLKYTDLPFVNEDEDITAAKEFVYPELQMELKFLGNADNVQSCADEYNDFFAGNN